MKSISTRIIFQIAGLLLLTGALSLKAATGVDTWTGAAGDNNWNTPGNWTGVNTPPATGDTPTFGSQGAGSLTLNNDISGGSFLGLTFNANAPSFILNGYQITTTGGLVDNSANLETVNIPIIMSGTHTVNAVSGGTMVLGGVISQSGTSGITKTGGGTVTLNGSAVNSYAGATTVNAGTLLEDFSNISPGSTANLISSSSALALGGGTLQINGNSAGSGQTFVSLTLNSGASTISAAPASGTIPAVTLNAISKNAGGSVVFIGPATINNSGNVAATATITTSTQGSQSTGALGILINGNPDNAYATVGLYDWASTDTTAGGAGTSPYTIMGGSQVTGFYNAPGNNNGMYPSGLGGAYNNDITAQQTPSLGGTSNIRCGTTGTTLANSIRFNNGHAPYIEVKSGNYLRAGGVLVTPNMGTINCGIDQLRLNAVACQIVQNNTAAVFCLGLTGGATDSPFFSNNNSTSEAVVISGLGAVFLNPGAPNHIAFNYLNASSAVTTSSSTYYDSTQAGSSTWGAFYINGGVTVINNANVLGNPTGTQSTTAGGGGTVNLNGGTLMAASTTANGGSVTLINAASTGSASRPVFLGGNGGGLAARSSTTFTVGGVVSGGSGTGPLTIGIPASSANGNIAGLVPGTGGSTLNPAFNATGTVLLNNGANTYAGGTVLASGTLQFTSGSLGTGGVTFNGGTLQWGSSTTTDISSQTVTVNSGGGTIDVNANSVTFANAIGNGGSGALTIKSTAGSGSLTLNGASTYTGGTAISSGTVLANNASGSATGSGNVSVASGATLGGTGTLAGNVTWQDGSFATLTQGSPMTVSGTVAFNGSGSGNTINVNASGLTSSGSPYTLLTASSISGNVNPTPGGIGIVASGYVGTISKSGNSIILTVTSSGVSSTWTDANHSTDDNWSDAGNWNSGVPHSAGDTATFGSGGAANPVNLDASETVGGIVFNNASSYTISGANTLTLDNNNSGATISVNDGTANAINTAVSLSDNTAILPSSGKALTVGGVIANASGSKALTINGAGTVVLSQANSYGPASSGTVGTTLSGGGTLQVGNNSALGSGDLNVSGSSTVQAGVASLNLANNISIASTMTVTIDNNGHDLTLGGTISGGGSLSKPNGGTLTLSGANTFGGSTVVGNGTLSVASDSNLGTAPGSATANSLVLGSGTSDLLFTGNASLNSNRGVGFGATSGSTGITALIDVAAGQSAAINGVIASAGNTGANSLTVNSGSGNTGTLTLGGANLFNGTTIIDAGTLTLGNSLALQNSTLDYDNHGGTLSFGSLTATTFGGLSGSQNLPLQNNSSATVTLTVGGNNGSTTFSGSLSGGGSLGKIGTGTMTLGNANYTGNTVVYNGGLTITGGTLSSHLDLSAQQGTVNAVISGASVTSPNGLYVTSPTGGSGSTVYGANATLTINNGAQVLANADANGRALSYGAATTASSGERPSGNGFLTVGTAGDTTTLVTANGAVDMFATSGGSTTGNFTVNLDGGTLAAKNIQETTYGAHQSGTFNFNGGTLKALASDGAANFIASTAAPYFTTVVNSGGAIIDANGFNITIATVLAHGTGTPDGGLVKLGAGKLTLSGANTYTGVTSVSNGTLVVNGSLASGSAVTVTNATLGGTGTIGGATALQPLAKLAPGDGVTPNVPLSFSSTLTLDAAATSIFAVNNTAGGAVNKVAVTGALTPNGSTIHLVNSGTPLIPGTYPLFNYSGGVSGTTFSSTPVFDVGTALHAGSSIVDNGSSQVSLVVPNTAPVAGSSFTLGAVVGMPTTVKIVGGKYSPTDSDGDTLTISSPSASNGTVTTDGTNITYTATSGSSDTITYTISDAYGGTAGGTINVAIAAAASYNQVSAQLVGSQEVLNYFGIPGDNYALEWTHDLTPPVDWEPLQTNAAAFNGSLWFTNTPSGGTDFYRTRSVP